MAIFLNYNSAFNYFDLKLCTLFCSYFWLFFKKRLAFDVTLFFKSVWVEEFIKILWGCFPEFFPFFDLCSNFWLPMVLFFTLPIINMGVVLVSLLCPEPQQLKPHSGLSDRQSVRKGKQPILVPFSWSHNSKFWKSFQNFSKFLSLMSPVLPIATTSNFLGD